MLTLLLLFGRWLVAALLMSQGRAECGQQVLCTSNEASMTPAQQQAAPAIRFRIVSIVHVMLSCALKSQALMISVWVVMMVLVLEGACKQVKQIQLSHPASVLCAVLLQVLPGEESPEVVPLWRWNGKYSSSRDSMPAGSDGWQGESELLGRHEFVQKSAPLIAL
jgi:hypothetical protein